MTLRAVYYEGNERFRVGAGEFVAPAAGEVRLDVAYCGICGTDVPIAHGAMAHRGRAELAAGETAVVLGAGPIGLLIALVAREAGAHVLLSELSPARIELARSLGFDVATPDEVGARVRELTEDAGADVVFEVSGAPP